MSVAHLDVNRSKRFEAVLKLQAKSSRVGVFSLLYHPGGSEDEDEDVRVGVLGLLLDMVVVLDMVVIVAIWRSGRLTMAVAVRPLRRREVVFIS